MDCGASLMRKRAIYTLSVLAVLLLVRGLHAILFELPGYPDQGPVSRILYIEGPAAFTAFLGFFAALVASAAYLITENFWYDSLAVATIEVSMAFAAINLTTHAIRARIVWGIWWTWDATLTTMFICFLLYLSYLVLRTAIDEPSRRALLSSVFCIFAFADIPIVWYSISWFRTLQPTPALRGGWQIESTLNWTWPALLLVALILILIRQRQEEMRREIDGLRRLAHAV
jgi:heme exporter protein C